VEGVWPTWSPGGNRIAFIGYEFSPRLDRWLTNIFTIHRDGTHFERVNRTYRRWDKAYLDWSSRNRLVFRATRGGKKGNELFTIRPRRLSSPPPDAQQSVRLRGRLGAGWYQADLRTTHR
jgi:Tol biopolymer transport system component